MNYRRFGRTGWMVSDIGYGMWGMGGWTGSDDAESLRAMQRAVDLGCNFFDTAYAYGNGHSEKLLGELLRANPGQRLYTATKIPPKNARWPARPEFSLDDCYPPDHIEQYVHLSLQNAGVQQFDLVQLHTWNDRWADDERWIRKFEDLRRQGLVGAVGISLNRWEPTNALRALRTGAVDAVQVVYNIFDQNPEDELFPLCRELDVAVIARVPFDEGSLTGTLTANSRWPEGDWRNQYFAPEKLNKTLARVEQVKTLLPPGMSLPQLALRFILSNSDVSTTIPGMRKPAHVESNLACSDAGTLPPELLQALHGQRWQRDPQTWAVP
jgi:aryl-alcohol dehydrogenase-like predicted oxidoreductase